MGGDNILKKKRNGIRAGFLRGEGHGWTDLSGRNTVESETGPRCLVTKYEDRSRSITE